MPANPFDLSASQSYALTIDNVDLADSTGHALSLYPTQSAKNVNDVYIHDSAINYSALTGILYGTNGVVYNDRFCDEYKAHNLFEFRDDPMIYAPRNIRIENNWFTGNNAGAMGGAAMRWVRAERQLIYQDRFHP